jgi:hypothetical protein
MNDLAAHYKFQIPIGGPLTPDALAGPIWELNRMPMGTLKYNYAIEELRTMVGLERRPPGGWPRASDGWVL